MLKSMRQSLFIFDSFVQSDESEDEEELLATEQNADEATGVRKVARKDSKKVKVWRYLVIIMLLVAGASTSALTYLLLNGEEEDDFETSVSFHPSINTAHPNSALAKQQVREGFLTDYVFVLTVQAFHRYHQRCDHYTYR